jgi:hypothetical protein
VQGRWQGRRDPSGLHGAHVLAVEAGVTKLGLAQILRRAKLAHADAETATEVRLAGDDGMGPARHAVILAEQARRQLSPAIPCGMSGPVDGRANLSRALEQVRLGPRRPFRADGIVGSRSDRSRGAPVLTSSLRTGFTGPKKQRAKSPDWLLYESDGVPLLECKSGRLRKDLKTIASHDEVRDGFATIYGQAARQLDNFEQAVSREPDLAWLRGRPLHPLILLLDPIYLSNSPPWEGERAFAKTKYGVRSAFNPEVMSVQALEHLAPMLDKRTFSDWVRAKANDLQKRDWDWEQYIDSNGGAINTRLEERWKAFFNSKSPDKDFVR